MYFPKSKNLSNLRLPHYTRKLWSSRRPFLNSIATEQTCTIGSILEFIYQNIIQCRIFKESNINILALANYLEKNDSPSTLNLLSKIASYALEAEFLFPKPIQLLTKHKTSDLTLSSLQIRCLLSLMFFCLFPKQEPLFDLPHLYTFASIFQADTQTSAKVKHSKLDCLFNYFKRQEEPVELNLTFSRRFLQQNLDWSNMNKILSRVELISERNCTEDYTDKLIIDFSNQYIGGGTLSSGAVQEEIIFFKHIELIVSILFTEKLEDKECLVIQGAQRFNKTNGFKNSFSFAEDFKENLVLDEWLRNRTTIVAIDANDYSGRVSDQFNIAEIERELGKAFIGFCSNENTEIITGKWGCGAFRGNEELKFIIQWLAASASGKSLSYLLWETDPTSIQIMTEIVQQRGAKIKDVYKSLSLLDPSQGVAESIIANIISS